MERKGFPESYDRRRLLRFLAEIKSGQTDVRAPVYSHLVYDVVDGEEVVVTQPDILIVEGLNVLQAAGQRERERSVFVSDYFDFSIYVDADVDHIRKWYVERFFTLRETAFRDPRSYFNRYSTLDDTEAAETATDIWTRINERNLYENIVPTRERADLILHKAADHAVTDVRLRRL
jgi:type I pantothenate kinase